MVAKKNISHASGSEQKDNFRNFPSPMTASLEGMLFPRKMLLAKKNSFKKDRYLFSTFLTVGVLFSLPEVAYADGIVTFPSGSCAQSGSSLTCSNYTGAGNPKGDSNGNPYPLVSGTNGALTSVQVNGVMTVTGGNASTVIGNGGADSQEGIQQVTIGTDGAIHTTSSAISINSNGIININGAVTSTSTSYNSTAGTGSDTIQFDSNTTLTISKTGSIYSGFNADGSKNNNAVYNAEVINPRGGGNSIINYGTIESNNSAAIWFQGNGKDASKVNIIDNYGTITAGGDGTQYVTSKPPVIVGNSSSSVVHFTNESGAVVNGDIALGTNKANLVTIYNGSTINGNLSGGGDAASLVLNGGAGGNDTLGSNISRFGTLTKSGGGTWTIENPLSNLSDNLTTAVNEGTLILAGSSAVKASSVTINANGTLQLGNGGQTGFLDGQVITNNGTLAFNHSDSGTPLDLTGTITGTGNLVQEGTDTMILSGTNNYTGKTTIKSGALQIGDGGTTGDINSSSSIENEGHLYFNRSDTYTFTKSISGSGDLRQKGSGTLVLTANSTYSGITYIDSGILQLGDGSNNVVAFKNPEIVDNGTLAINYGNDFVISQHISGVGGLTQMGAGNTIIDGSNTDQITYTGATSITGGQLILSGDGSLSQSSGVHNNAAFDISGVTQGGTSIQALDGAGTIALGANTLTLTNANEEFGNIYSGVASGTGGLTLANGTEILTGMNSYTGATTIASGTLQLGAGGTSGDISGSSAIHNNGTLIADRSDTLQLSQVIDGTGNFVQQGGGTTVLKGENTYTGNTDVLAGTLQVEGASGSGDTNVYSGATLSGSGVVRGNATIASGATLSPGNGHYEIGTLTIGKDLTLEQGSTQNFHSGLANVAGGAFNDLVDVKGNLTLGGVLNVSANPQGEDASAGLLDAGVYRIYTYGGTLSGVDNETLGKIDAKSGVDFALQTSIDHQVNLVVNDGSLNFWDGSNVNGNHGNDGSSGNSKVDGGSGVWTAINGEGDNNWTNDAGSRNAPWNSGDYAVFEGQAGTVTVLDAPSHVTFRAMQFANNDGGTYVITGADLYATQSVTKIRVGDGTTTGANITADLDTVMNESQVSGGTSLEKNDLGTLIISKDQTYTGATTIESGTLQLGNGGTSGDIAGSSAIHNNGTLAVDRSDALTLSQAIDGTGNLVQRGNGATLLTNANSYTGATTIESGTLQLGNGGTSGDIAGSSGIHNNGTLAVDRSDALTLSQAIDGTGSLVQRGSGTTLLTNANSYTGGTQIESGTLSGSTTSFGSGDITNNAALVVKQDADGTLSNVLQGGGSFTKAGTSTVNIERDDAGFTGATTVAEGTLSVNGSLANSAVTVNDRATLSGVGMVGSATIANGGTLSPAGGGGVGTLSVNGNLAMSTGSVLAADGTSITTGATLSINNISYQLLKSDLVSVAGATQLSGGVVTFRVEDGAALKYGQAWTLLTSKNGVSGTYGTLNTNLVNAYTYLSPVLVYTENEVNLILSRNNKSFSDGGDTRNEQATGHGLDNLPEDSRVVQAMEQLSGNDVHKGLNALSGEVHASAKTALIQDSFFVRQAAFDRLDTAECDGSLVDSSIHTAALKNGRDDGHCYTNRAVLWGEAYGSLGHNAGDGNATALHHSTAGFVMGADTTLYNTWRVGGLMSYGRSMFDIKNGRGSSGHSNNVTIGGYAGNHWGNLNLRLGATYTWNMLNTQRYVSFSGYNDRLSSGYLGGTAQAFAELGYKFRSGHTTVEPFGNVAYVNLHTNGYNEHGGAAALHGRGMDTGVTFSTFGIKAASTFQVGAMQLTPHGSFSYRHAFGLTTATTHQMFAATTSGDMDIAGVALSTDTAVIDTGITAKITDRLDVGLSYIGQYGKQSVDSGARARFTLKF